MTPPWRLRKSDGLFSFASVHVVNAGSSSLALDSCGSSGLGTISAATAWTAPPVMVVKPLRLTTPLSIARSSV